MLYAGKNNIRRIIKELCYYNNINIDTIYKLIYKMYYINRNIEIININNNYNTSIIVDVCMCLHVLINTCVFFDTKLIILL